MFPIHKYEYSILHPSVSKSKFARSDNSPLCYILDMNRKLFGTDGIRARAGEFPLNAQTLVAIGRAVGEKLGGKVLVWQDTRVSSPWIFDHLQRGIASTPATVQNAGVIPTPA